MASSILLSLESFVDGWQYATSINVLFLQVPHLSLFLFYLFIAFLIIIIIVTAIIIGIILLSS